MAAPLEISLSGVGTAMHLSERAILALHAESNQLPTQAAASSVVTATSNAIRDLLMPYCPQDEATGRTMADAPISQYSMSTLNTNRHAQVDKNRDPVQPLFSACAVFNIKFADFAVLNNLATRLSAMENVKISGLTWCLTDETLNSLKGGTRKRAAHDSLQKAWDYASVFAGLTAAEVKQKVRPITVSESSHYSSTTRPTLHYGKAQRMRGIGVASTEELHFEPEDVKLEVTVKTKFVVDS